jgi:hypothetical protein
MSQLYVSSHGTVDGDVSVTRIRASSLWCSKVMFLILIYEGLPLPKPAFSKFTGKDRGKDTGFLGLRWP